MKSFTFPSAGLTPRKELESLLMSCSGYKHRKAVRCASRVPRDSSQGTGTKADHTLVEEYVLMSEEEASAFPSLTPIDRSGNYLME